MKIAIVVDNESWILPHACDLMHDLTKNGHIVDLHRDCRSMSQGDVAFYLGCVRLTPDDVLERNRFNLVVHESHLPKGKGFAPIAWQILEGNSSIPIVLFLATKEVDSGPIFLQDEICLEGHELLDEIRQLQGIKTIELCKKFVELYPHVTQKEQVGQATFFPRRTPADSKLDTEKSLREQFQLLRIVDNKRYPAFFDMNGYRYILQIEKRPIGLSNRDNPLNGK